MPSSFSTSSSSSETATPTTTTSSTSSSKFDLHAWQNGPITNFDQTSFAEYWDDLPSELIVFENDSINNNDNTKNKNNKNRIDPYNVYHRMAIGKYLIENSCCDLWKTNPNDKHYKHHWYWTYLAQLDWLWKSGRLSSSIIIQHQRNLESQHRRQEQQQAQQGTSSSSSTNNSSVIKRNKNSKKSKPKLPQKINKQQQKPTANTTTISHDSWWSYINLGFSICIYLGAVKAGIVPTIRLVQKSNKNINIIESDQHLQNIIDVWYDFFRLEYIPLISTNRHVNLNKNPSTLYPFYRQLWKYHIQTIDYAVKGAQRFVKFMPDQEHKFGIGWCNMSIITSAMGWSHLSLVSIMKYGFGTLPSSSTTTIVVNNNLLQQQQQHRRRPMKEDQKAEYETYQNMINLSTKTKLELYDISKFWLRVSQYRLVQYYLPTLLKKLNKGTSISKTITFVLLLIFAAIPTSLIEFGFWGLILSLIVTIIYFIIL